jgi:hypothetical protein
MGGNPKPACRAGMVCGRFVSLAVKYNRALTSKRDDDDDGCVAPKSPW